MAGIAAAFAAEQVIPVLLLCGEGRLPRKEVVEFRREGTDAVGGLISSYRQSEFVEVFGGKSTIRSAELKRSGVSTEYSGALGSAAHRRDVWRPIYFQ